MPASLRNLSTLSFGQGVTMWAYVTNDSRRDIEGHAYWADAINVVKPGDWLFVTHQAAAGNTIYAFARDPDGTLRVRHLCSTFSTRDMG